MVTNVFKEIKDDPKLQDGFQENISKLLNEI